MCSSFLWSAGCLWGSWTLSERRLPPHRPGRERLRLWKLQGLGRQRTIPAGKLQYTRHTFLWLSHMILLAALVWSVHLLLRGRQGVRAVIAESFEKLHKNQLVGMGIMPLQFLPGQNADSLELSGKERFTITLPDSLNPRQQLTVKVGSRKSTLSCDNCQSNSQKVVHLMFIVLIWTQDSRESSVDTEWIILRK